MSNWRSLVAKVALDAALLRPHQDERIDTVAVIDELRRLSFLEEHISKKDGAVFVSVPLVAAIFGKRKLSTYADQSFVEEDTRFLHRFGAMQSPDLKWGLEPRVQRLFKYLSEELAKSRVNLAKEMPVLELIAREHTHAWLMIADLWRESAAQDAPTQIINGLTRYIEATTPGDHQSIAWERIAVIHRQQGDWLGFVNAQVQIAELPGAGLPTVSAAVNTFNSVRHQVDAGAKRSLAQRLVRLMEPMIADGDATDCSRLAWALMQAGEPDRARMIVEQGLKLESGHEHCVKLKARLR